MSLVQISITTKKLLSILHTENVDIVWNSSIVGIETERIHFSYASFQSEHNFKICFPLYRITTGKNKKNIEKQNLEFIAEKIFFRGENAWKKISFEYEKKKWFPESWMERFFSRRKSSEKGEKGKYSRKLSKNGDLYQNIGNTVSLGVLWEVKDIPLKCTRYNNGNDLVSWRLTLKWADGGLFFSAVRCRRGPSNHLLDCIRTYNNKLKQLVFVNNQITVHVLKCTYM